MSRTAIRAAIKTIAASIPGISSVHIGPRRNLADIDLPALCVYVESEEKQLDSINTPRVFVRDLRVTSEIHAKAASAEALELSLDALSASREAAITADETLGGLVESIFPVEDEYQIDESAAESRGVAICRDQVVYRG